MSQTTRRIRVLLAGAEARNALGLESALVAAGYDVIAREADATALEQRVRELEPDAIVIHSDSPARDTLEHLALLHGRWPRPMLMLCGEGDAQIARAAVQAGVSFYVVDRLSPAAVRSLVDMAVLHFQDRQLLTRELAQAQQALEDRRTIDRAKCLLMEVEGLSEAQAYHRLRRLAMQRGQRLGDLARALLARQARADGTTFAIPG
jgi:two-component system, response regulator / RNA-binding antiterminator